MFPKKEFVCTEGVSTTPVTPSFTCSIEDVQSPSGYVRVFLSLHRSIVQA